MSNCGRTAAAASENINAFWVRNERSNADKELHELLGQKKKGRWCQMNSDTALYWPPDPAQWAV